MSISYTYKICKLDAGQVEEMKTLARAVELPRATSREEVDENCKGFVCSSCEDIGVGDVGKRQKGWDDGGNDEGV
jgi:hypothetical protein